jgi:hypothetical protein
MPDRRTSANYIAAELHNVNVYQSDKVKVQFRDLNGLSTKWLFITQEQFKEIERILTLGTQGQADS